jgi:hypothetical protein
MLLENFNGNRERTIDRIGNYTNESFRAKYCYTSKQVAYHAGIGLEKICEKS